MKNIKRKIATFFILFPYGLILGIGLASCEQRGESIVEEFDRTQQKIELEVVYHPNKREVSLFYDDWLENKDKSPPRYGFAYWSFPDELPRTCKIHVVEPKFVDDEYTLTLGHELLHCLHGRYHRSAE